ALAAALPFAPSAHAQLPRLPAVPGVALPGAVNDTVGRVANTVGSVAGQVDRLADARRLRVDDLLRTQRASVERDPAGQPILRAEIVAFDPTEAALDRARAAGFQVARERGLEGLDARVVVLRAPEGMTTRRALTRMRALDPQGAYDYNHVYLDSGVALTASSGAEGSQRTGASEPALSGSTSSFKVGLVDGGVDVSHPVF